MCVLEARGARCGWVCSFACRRTQKLLVTLGTLKLRRALSCVPGAGWLLLRQLPSADAYQAFQASGCCLLCLPCPPCNQHPDQHREPGVCACLALPALQTSTLSNNETPVWEEEFDFVVDHLVS